MTLHLLTPEYPPLTGGVSDYTRRVAHGLAEAGDRVHVWCPPLPAHDNRTGIEVHPEFGRFTFSDLRHVGARLDQFESPRRLLVQWVPHGYGFRAMNVGFCAWLWARSLRGDQVELMVHEPYFAFWEGTWRQTAAAAIHRLMTLLLLQASHRVWVAIPAWATMFRPYALGRQVRFDWLPIPSSVGRPDPAGVTRLRGRLGMDPLVGHIGTYSRLVTPLLGTIISALLRSHPHVRVLLIGAGSEEFAARFAKESPDHSKRVLASGLLSERDLAEHVAVCDVLVQPFPDGVSSRRTSVMAGMHLGVPVVTTKGKLTEPLWESSGAVRLTAVGDSAGCVEHVIQLLKDPAERKRVADIAQVLYSRTFDIDRTVNALRSVA